MRSIKLFNSRLVPLAAALLICMTIFTACGSSGGGSDASNPNGELVVSLTDGAGDFANYEVDVTDIRLTGEDGTEVSVLPTATRVNFAQYTDLTEVLVATKVPIGNYESVTFSLDYSDADIWVRTAVGDLVKVDVSNIIDENGTVVTKVDVTVDLDPENPLIIDALVPVHLQLDFDLELTSSPIFGTDGTIRISVDPYVLIEIDITGYKIHRLRGLVGEVTPEDDSFTVTIQPFHTPLDGSWPDFGSMTVAVNSETLYEINNETYEGAEGLEAMATLSGISPVVVEGEFNLESFRFEAESVYVGTSVPWGIQDVAYGVVTAREGNELTLKGVSLTFIDGHIDFLSEVTVALSENTVIKREFSMEEVGLEDIAVGQRISVFGTMTGDDPENMVLDATNGYVRIYLTPIFGIGTI